MPMKMKNMKGIDLFCASPASTAICSTTDHRSMVRNGSKPLHHHRLIDHYKKTFSNNNNNLHSNHNYFSPASSKLAPCISELPFTPRSKPKPKAATPRRKSSADVSDLRDKFTYGKSNIISPPRGGHSSRYLLGDSPFLDSLSSSSEGQCLALVPSTPVVRSEERELTTRLGSLMVAEKENATHKKNMINKSYERTERSTNCHDYGQIIMRQKSMGLQKTDSNSTVVKPLSSSSSSRDQVVVLRVSLHCRGCEGKLRKYLSKMEGVKSFSIDLETKKVTVVGNVTPLGLLTSISKVKYAQLWPYPASSSSGSSSSSSTSSTSDFNY